MENLWQWLDRIHNVLHTRQVAKTTDPIPPFDEKEVGIVKESERDFVELESVEEREWRVEQDAIRQRNVGSGTIL